jgi:hypothetical protein
MGFLFSEITIQFQYSQNHSRMDLDYWFYRAIISGGALSPNSAIFSIRRGGLFFRVRKWDFLKKVNPLFLKTGMIYSSKKRC